MDTLFDMHYSDYFMVKRTVTIGILGVVALVGIAATIPTGLTSLIITGIAVIGIAALLIGSVIK